MSRVLAVVLNWNGHAMTVRCVEHLRRQDHPSIDILVVDNGSTDGSPEILSAGVVTPAELRSLSENVGFTGGMNIGLEAARAGAYDYVWLVNNDAFAEQSCLSTLVRFMEAEPNVAATTPRIVGTDGVDQNFGGKIVWEGPHTEMLFPADSAEGDVWLTGTALLVVEHKTDLLERVADRVVVIAAGRIVLSGAAETVLADPRLVEFGVGPPAAVRMSRLAQGAGVRLEP